MDTDQNNEKAYSPVEEFYLLHEKPDEVEAFYAKIKKMPEAIGDMLFAVATPKKIKAICQRFNLHLTQAMYLSRIIRNIAVANLYFGDMVQIIQSELDTTSDTARSVAQAVTELYSFALEDIKKLQVQTFPDRIKGTPAPAQSNVINLKHD